MADKPNGKNGKTPIITQSVTVQRNPFVSPQVDPRPSVQISARADLTKEYVAASNIGFMPFLRALPQYIDDLTQQFGLTVYENMMKDPVVYASERVFTLAIIASGWEITPSLPNTEPDYDIAVKMADFVRENLENLETSYDTILEQHLNAFEYGCSIAEQIYKVEDGKVLLRDIRDKPLQNAVFVVDSYNKTVGILTQRFPGQMYPANSYIPIDFAMQRGTQGENRIELSKNGEVDLSKQIPGFLPRYLFSVLTNEMRYNDERGHSGLRAAYQAWWLKQQMVGEYLSYLSKFASPSLIVKTAQHLIGEKIVDENLAEVPDPTTGLPQTITPEQAVVNELLSFQNGSVFAVPFGTEVDVVMPTGDGGAFSKAFTYCNAEIVRGITFQYLATSEGEHQAKASSETHQDILSLGILRRKRWLANQQRREVFLPLLRYNFDLSGKRIKRYVPKLSLGFGNGFPLNPDVIARLASAQYLDPSQHARIDEMIGLPQRETVMINGAPMTPTQLANQQREDQQMQQQREDAQAAQQAKAENA